MHEYLDPLSPYNMGLICCNETSLALIGSFCFFVFYTSPGNTCSSPDSPQFLGRQHSPTDHSIISLRPKCKCNVIKERPRLVHCVRRWVSFSSPLLYGVKVLSSLLSLEIAEWVDVGQSERVRAGGPSERSTCGTKDCKVFLINKWLPARMSRALCECEKKKPVRMCWAVTRTVALSHNISTSINP